MVVSVAAIMLSCRGFLFFARVRVSQEESGLPNRVSSVGHQAWEFGELG